MIVLHLSIWDRVPYLWGEQSPDQIIDPPETHPDIRTYPFDPGIKGLRRVLKAFFPELKILKSNTFPSLVWLPSRGNQPIPSTSLIEVVLDRRHKICLKPYSVNARKLTLEELLDVSLLACSLSLKGSGVVLGASFKWIENLVKLTLDMLVREDFLPGMVQCRGYWEARWRPVPDRQREKELERLSASMPGVCRCLNNYLQEPPDIFPEVVTRSLVTDCADSFIRNSKRSLSALARTSSPKRKTYTSLHDAWIDGLISKDAVVRWEDTAEIMDFARQLGEWQRPVKITAESPFQFCFRLSEPVKIPEEDSEENSWQVDYLLQPKADPTLMLSVADLWETDSRASRQLRKYGGNASEYLLTVLGQSSRLCPEISGSLKQKKTGGFALDGNGALRFLTDSAEMLKRAGFTVMLPSWWVGQGPAKKLGLKMKTRNPVMQSGGNISLDSIMDFDYQVSLDGEMLSLDELEELARLKSPLVCLKGQWTHISGEQIEAAIKFLKKKQSQSLSGKELMKIAFGAEKEVEGLFVEEVEADGWLKEVIAKLTGQGNLEMQKQPDGFSGKLRPYQERGYSWLSFLRSLGLGACLADDMGLGKTIQTLALIQQEREKGENRPVLLICPTSVVNNWKKEAEQFTPRMNLLVHHGYDRRKKEAFCLAATEQTLVISSYGLLFRDMDFLKNVDWAGIILDEAQNIKNPETKQSRAVRNISSDYRIALTGTPVENHVGDLWALMDFLNPGLLGSQNYFKNKFYRPIQLSREEDAALRLKKLTGPFILRRLKTDKSIISDLPEKIESKEFCTLTREQVSLYKAVLNEMEEKLERTEGIERKGMVLASLSKLKQVCNHPAQFAGDGSDPHGRSGKLTRLVEMLTQIREAGERTLLFTQYAEMGLILKNYLKEQFMEDVFFISGAVPRKKRDEMVQCFQEDTNAPYTFILSLKAGGTGLNLTRANHVFHYDRWWNPAVEDQATDRAFRIGQTKNVQVHKFIVAGTLEERIDEMIERKSSVADQVVGKGESWLTELSNREIGDLVKLGKEALGE